MAVNMTTQSIAVGNNWVKVGNDYVGDNPSGTAPSYQLPTANYVDTGMPMNLVFPRPEAASWSYAKNAYPNVKWNIPIGIQGGAWPFNYEITDNGGATGLAIGSFLLGVIDGPTGKTTYSVPDDYGVLSWDAPQTGSYSITVRVTDQTGATLDVAVSLTVGTSGWLFVDPVNGNDSTGDGTVGSPFATLWPLHNGSQLTTTYANQRVYMRDGVHNVVGQTDQGANYRIENGFSPVQYIGYPNESAAIELDGGWFVLWDCADSYFGDLTIGYKSDFLPNTGGPCYVFAQLETSARDCFHNIHFNRFQGTATNTGSGNSATIYSNDGVSQHKYVSRCLWTGTNGYAVDCYLNSDFVVEHCTFENVTTYTNDGSSQSLFYLKVGNSFGSLRNLNAWDNVGIGATTSGVGINGAERFGYTTHDLEVCYCTISLPDAGNRMGAMRSGTLSTYTAETSNLWWYRNSLEDVFSGETANQNMPDDTDKRIKNILQGGVIPEEGAQVLLTDNIDNGSFFDASMKLTGTSRTNYLGTHGAEVAQ